MSKQRKKGAGRPVKAVSERRLMEVVQLILEGKTRKEIDEYIVTEFNYQPSSCNRFIHKANQYIAENYSVRPEVVINRHIEMYYELAQMWKTMDGATSIKAMQSIEKLLHLHKPETLMQNNTLNLNLKDLSMKELKELLNGDE